MQISSVLDFSDPVQMDKCWLLLNYSFSAATKFCIDIWLRLSKKQDFGPQFY